MTRKRHKPPRTQTARNHPAPGAARPAATRPKTSADRPAAVGLDRADLGLILLLFIVVWLVAANSLSGAFVLDDGSKIVENTDIRQLRDLPSKLIYPYQGHTVLERNDPSRPLVFLVYGLVYHFFQLNPVPYHAVNTLFHFGSAALVFLLARMLLWHLTGARKRLAPLLVSLFFAVTPIQMGTVIYAYALNDILSSFLTLLSVYCFVRKAEPGRLDLGASLVAMALALFTKQSAVIVPVLILAFDYFIVCRMSGTAMRARLRLYWGYAGLVAAFLVYRFWYFGALGDIEGAGNTQPALAYAFAQPVVILKYLWSSVVPYGLAIDHYLLPNSFGAGIKGLAFAGLLLVAAAAAYLWRRPTPLSRFVLFSAAFYFVVLAPTSSLMPTVDIMVERRVYLANVGLFLLVVLLWDRLARVDLLSGTINTVAVGAVCVHLAALAGVSVLRSATYATNEGVWLDVLKVYPASERALNNLGTVYLDQKQYEKARDCFEQLVARNPKDYIAQQNLGSIFERPGSPYHDEEKAIGHFAASVASNPEFAPGYYNLGRLYQKHAQERHDEAMMREAERCYTKTLALNPNHVLAHNNLGLLYVSTGRATQARQEYEAALRLDPNCAPARKNLALLDASPASAGDANTVPADQVPPELLMQLYEQALQRDPGNAQIRQKYDEMKRKQAGR